MNIQFCPYTIQESRLIKEVLQTVFTITDYQRIDEAYATFKGNYYDVPATEKETISRTSLVPITKHSGLLEKFADERYAAGIDLPILLCPENKSKETVFIVAEDPLRDCNHKDVILSTPFGTHLSKIRNGKLNIYWKVIEYLVDRKMNVYVTDVNKLWLKRSDSKKEYFPADLEQHFYEALQKEISLFNPLLIISFGNVANRMAERLEARAKQIAFPHPAGTANGKWKKVLEPYQADIRCTAEEKVKYMTKEIDKLLSR